jgi:hypothetical protein
LAQGAENHLAHHGTASAANDASPVVRAMRRRGNA